MLIRFRDFFSPARNFAMRRCLERTQWTSRGELDQYQASLLRDLLVYAGNRVPYYRDLFRTLGFDPDKVTSAAALRRLPVLTKEEVRQKRDSFVSEEAGKLGVHRDHTSGSTGTALEFFVDRRSSVMEFATVWRHWNWAGYRIGQKVADIRGRTFSPDSKRPWRRKRSFRILQLSSFHMTDTMMARYVDKLNRYRPVILRGYPSALHTLSEFTVRNGLSVVSPKSVVTSSETLLEGQRDMIGRAFRCPVLDFYGMNERTVTVNECPEGGRHINMEYGVFRVVAPSGEDAGDGEEGEVVATGLHNYAMPLINYATRDLAVATDRKCSCGRGLPLVERIDGRIEDVVIGADGRRVGRLDAAFKYAKGLIRAQVLQRRRGEVDVLLHTAEEFTSADEDRLTDELKARLGSGTKVAYRYVEADAIGLTPAGKLRFVISELDDGKQLPVNA